jgi:hypothetical protein
MKGGLYYKGMVLEERQIGARGDFCAYIEEGGNGGRACAVRLIKNYRGLHWFAVMEDRWVLKSEVGGSGAWRSEMGGDIMWSWWWSSSDLILSHHTFCFWLRGKIVVRGIFGIWQIFVRTMADGEDSIFHLWKEYFQEELYFFPQRKFWVVAWLIAFLYSRFLKIK